MEGDKTCVAIRVRPLNDREISAGQTKAFKCIQNSIAQVAKDDSVIGNVLFLSKKKLA